MPKISIAAARVNAKLTQEQLADKLGVSKTTIWNWENGNTEPTLSQLREICSITEIPLDFIFLPEKSNDIGLEETESEDAKSKTTN